MADALSYATPQCSPPGILLEDVGGGAVRITIPAQPTWPVAVGLALGLILAGLGTLLGTFILVTSTRGDLSWGGGLTAVIATASFGGVVVHLLIRLQRLPRTGSIPTVIEANPEGLSVSTVRRGTTELLHYPARRMLGFGLYAGPLSLTLRRTLRIAMRLRLDGTLNGRETVILEFEAGNSGRPDPLDAALRNALRLDPSTAAEARTLRWEMIVRRI